MQSREEMHMDLCLGRFENRSMQERSTQRGSPKKVQPSQPKHGDRVWTGMSADGHLRYALRRTASGLVLERQRVSASVERALQTVSFGDEASFGRWCDEDDMRYEYSQLCATVRKRGVDLFERSIGFEHAQREFCFR